MLDWEPTADNCIDSEDESEDEIEVDSTQAKNITARAAVVANIVNDHLNKKSMLLLLSNIDVDGVKDWLMHHIASHGWRHRRLWTGYLYFKTTID